MSTKMRQTLRLRNSLALTPSMRQAIGLLAQPLDQVDALVREALETNPFLRGRPLPPPQVSEAGAHWEQVAETPSVWRLLAEQIGDLMLSAADARLAEFLVEDLDERGFISRDLEVLAEEAEVTSAQLETLLARLQRLEPAGLFARDMGECWRLQLAAQDKLDDKAERLLASLADGKLNRVDQLAGAARLTQDETLGLLQKFQSLNANPLDSLSTVAPTPQRPDLRFEKETDGSWRVRNLAEFELGLDQELVSRVRKSPENRDDKEAQSSKAFVKTRQAEAKALIQAVQQRSESLMRLGEALADVQRGFLEEGDGALMPYRMGDAAETLGLHVSTISRLVAHKLVETPWGTRPLRSFFPLPVGDAMDSAPRVKAALARLVADETEALSDQALSDALAQRGHRVARRTVAKYREALGLPSAQNRRRNRKIARVRSENNRGA